MYLESNYRGGGAPVKVMPKTMTNETM